jgi:hypothetical protein
MRSTIRFMLMVVAACVTLVASVFTAFATSSGQANGGDAGLDLPGAPASRQFVPAAAACTDMQATDVAWVTLTPNHHIDKQVASYPSGTSDITPVFQYSCAPANTTIVSVFSLDGLTVFTDQEAIKPRNSAGLYAYALEPVDGSPVADGEWGVQYFSNKTLLTTGSVVVGSGSSDPAQTTSATVQGVVQDKDSQAPIEGAVILVLKPGVKLQDFIQNGQQDSDVYTAGKSDSQGAFTLQKKIVRHQVFAMIVAVQGYKSLGSETFQVNDEPDPVSITIAMVK